MIRVRLHPPGSTVRSWHAKQTLFEPHRQSLEVLRVVDKLFDNGVSVQIVASCFAVSISTSFVAAKRCKHGMISGRLHDRHDPSQS